MVRLATCSKSNELRYLFVLPWSSPWQSPWSTRSYLLLNKKRKLTQIRVPSPPQTLVLLLIPRAQLQELIPCLSRQLNHIFGCRVYVTWEDSKDVPWRYTRTRDTWGKEDAVSERCKGVHVKPTIAPTVRSCSLYNHDMSLNNGNSKGAVMHGGWKNWVVAFVFVIQRAMRANNNNNNNNRLSPWWRANLDRL